MHRIDVTVGLSLDDHKIGIDLGQLCSVVVVNPGYLLLCQERHHLCPQASAAIHHFLGGHLAFPQSLYHWDFITVSSSSLQCHMHMMSLLTACICPIPSLGEDYDGAGHYSGLWSIARLLGDSLPCQSIFRSRYDHALRYELFRT